MPRPPRPWFRFYSEALESLKVHELPDRYVKHWLYLLCLANISNPRGRLPSLPKVAFALRVNEERAKAIIATLVDKHFIDLEGKHYVMHEWDDFQRDSDARDTPGRRGDSAAEPPQNRGGAGTLAPHRVEKRKVDKELEEEQSRAEQSAAAFASGEPDLWDEVRPAFEDVLGLLNGAVVQEAREYAQQVPVSWCLLALEETRTKADRPSWAFTKAVLDRAIQDQQPPGPRQRAPVKGDVRSARAQLLARARSVAAS